MTNLFPSVLWHCCFGHLACKNCLRNDLLCVEWDVKPYTLTESPCPSMWWLSGWCLAGRLSWSTRLYCPTAGSASDCEFLTFLTSCSPCWTVSRYGKVCVHKWLIASSDKCRCGPPQTMHYIMEWCLLTDLTDDSVSICEVMFYLWLSQYRSTTMSVGCRCLSVVISYIM